MYFQKYDKHSLSGIFTKMENYSLGHFIGPSGVRALPLAAGRNEGGHYFRYFSFFFSSFLVGTVVQNPRRGCRRVPKFSMGS